MPEPTPYDNMFMTLYESKERPFARSLENTFERPLELLEEIYSAGFALKERNGQESITTGRGDKYNYWLNEKGRSLVENLPNDFNERPYSYYLELNKQLKVKEEEKDELDNKVKAITISHTNFQRKVTLISLGIALASILASIFVPLLIRYLDRDEIKNTKTEVPQIDTLIQTQQQLLKEMKDFRELLRKDSATKN